MDAGATEIAASLDVAGSFEELFVASVKPVQPEEASSNASKRAATIAESVLLRTEVSCVAQFFAPRNRSFE
jgi:hypothetical protein